MFSLARWLFVALLCLVGIGLYRGWFTLSSPSRDTQNHKVNINLSVDAEKLEADAAKVKEKISERVVRRVKSLESQDKRPDVK